MKDIIMLLKRKGLITDADLSNMQEVVYLNNDNTAKYEEAVRMINHMYHTESSRKYIGEKYNLQKAQEVQSKYSHILPTGVSCVDIYLAINEHYHNYIKLFKTWFSDNLDCKIIEAAIQYWFLDEDTNYADKMKHFYQ